jgi:transaldolase
MKATKLLHNLGQRLWLDSITHDLLNTGTFKRCIDELSITGLTSNQTISSHRTIAEQARAIWNTRP